MGKQAKQAKAVVVFILFSLINSVGVYAHACVLAWEGLALKQSSPVGLCSCCCKRAGEGGDGQSFRSLQKILCCFWLHGINLPCDCVYANVTAAGEGGGGLSSRSFFNVRVELTEEGNRRVAEVVEVLFKYLDLVKAPGGINTQVGCTDWLGVAQTCSTRHGNQGHFELGSVSFCVRCSVVAPQHSMAVLVQ